MTTLKYTLHSYDATTGAPIYYAEIAGLSTESKPTAGLASGSKFLEVNTGKSFVLDAESDTHAWHEVVVKTAASE